ncbi:protein kinase [Basidiobolus ranarum]|uniref:Protein kinase n=1 Tax=Basidiobolus ranarum TaxID=34480 RepID=A0ABR2WJ44_9FUNG
METTQTTKFINVSTEDTCNDSEDPLGVYLESLDFLLTIDSPESLKPLLKKITKLFSDDKKYINDSRYLNIWLLRSRNSSSPLNVFRKMEVLQIGRGLAAFYEEYARCWLERGRIDKAKEIYLLGINQKAKPLDQLWRKYRSLPVTKCDYPKKTKIKLVVAIRRAYDVEEKCFEEIRSTLTRYCLNRNTESTHPVTELLSQSVTKLPSYETQHLSTENIPLKKDKSVETKLEETKGHPSKYQACEPEYAEICDPHNSKLVAQFLENISTLLSQYPGFFNLREHAKGHSKLLQNTTKPGRKSISKSVKRSLLFLGNSSFIVQKKLGEGGFGKVYLVQSLDSTPELVNQVQMEAFYSAMKVQTPADAWEFHILNQLHQRLCSKLSKMIVKPYALYYYQDMSYLLMECSTQGTLLDVVNYHKVQGKLMDEITVMFFAVEILKIIEGLHNAQILHSDLKVDNILLRMEKVDHWDESYAPEGEQGWHAKGLKIIDFGRAIDLSLFPNNSGFLSRHNGNIYDCPEIRQRRVWTYQIDYYGLANVIHTMLHGKYLEVTQTVLHNKDHSQKVYQPILPFKRYWQVELWQYVFHTLLNPQTCGSLPITGRLQSIRKTLETHLILRGNHVGKSLKKRLTSLENHFNKPS